MNMQRLYRWLLPLGLTTVACIPDVGNERPGVCSAKKTRCIDTQIETCGPDYHWHSGMACGGDKPDCTGGACQPYPISCTGLLSNCGPSGAENCCESKTITGGTWQRLDTGSSAQVTATVSDFKLDRFEVTVGRFRSFVTFLGTGPVPAGAGKHPSDPHTGWDSVWNTALQTYLPMAMTCGSSSTYKTWTDTPGANENLPINCVYWVVALAFCAWDGGRLPTEAEWQYAATIDREGNHHMFPWGDSSPSGALAVYCETATPNQTQPCMPSTPTMEQVGSKSPAGDSPWGLADLAGNVWEWTLDSEASYPPSCTDCLSFDAPSDQNNKRKKEFRGGSWNYGQYFLAGDLRTSQAEDQFNEPKQGFRCARSP